MSPVTEEAITDVAAALFQHVGDHGLAGVPHALDVHIDVEVAGGVVHLLKGSQTAHTGVAAGHVDFAEGVHALLGGCVHLGTVGHVGHHGDDLAAVFLAQLLGGLFHAGIQVDHDQLCAVFCVGNGNALTQTGRCAGNQCYLTIQFCHGESLLYNYNAAGPRAGPARLPSP